MNPARFQQAALTAIVAQGKGDVPTAHMLFCEIDPERCGEVTDTSWDYQDSLMDHPLHYQGIAAPITCKCGQIENVVMRLEIGFFGMLKLLAEQS